jgi:hypothetical protein
MKRLISIIILTQLAFLNADNYSLSFDGVDDYVEYITDMPDDDATYECWFKSNNINSHQTIMYMRGDYNSWLYLLNGKLQFHQDHWGEDLNVNIELNTWYHAALTFEYDAPNTLVTLWLNGVDVDSKSHDINTSWNQQFWLGFPDNNGDYFNGSISSVRVSTTVIYVDDFEAANNFTIDESTHLLWNFNEGTGTTLTDQTSNDNDGTINGATWSTNVPPASGGNNALSFDGSGDYVDLGDQLDITGDFTISAYINIENSETVHTIYAKSDETYSSSGAVKGYMFHVYNGVLKLGYRLSNGEDFGAVSSETTIEYNQWYNVAVTRSNNDIQLFIDGESVGSGTFSGDITFPDGVNTYIGRWWNGGTGYTGYYYVGLIDEVAIWNTARTQSEIQNNMSTELNGSENGLVGNWNFNEGTGTTLTDQTSNDNDGTITGASWTGNGAPVTEATTATNTHSLSFDGVDDYVDIGRPISTENGDYASISAWFKTNTSTFNDGYGTIVTNDTEPTNPEFKIMVINGGYVQLSGGPGSVSGPNIITTNTYNDNNWHHVIGTKYGSNCVGLYIDGDYIGNDCSGSGDMDAGNNYFIGSGRVNGNGAFNGIIDNVFIWDDALTAAEITALYNSGNGLDASSNSGNYTSSSNLQGYWNFNEGSGATASDATSNGNDGTIYGATWSTDVPFSGTTTTSALTWSVQAQASIGSYNDNDNYLGVASDATNTFDASYDEVESPASPGSSVSLYFPHEEWDNILGDNFSSDIRPEVTLTDTMQVWDFEVSSTDAGEATLTFAFTDVPEVPVILEYTATGARETLSNNATYTFTVVADSAYSFRVSIGDTTSPSLTLGSSCSGPAILISDSTHSLDWTATDGFEVDSVLVSFSSDSGTTYTLQAALGTVSGYDWTVPDTTIIYEGILKIKAMDYAGNETESESNYIFAVAGDSLTTSVTAGWTLWGAPINPANDTMTVNLDDDFSNYWVTYDYVDNGYTYDGILKETEGYWLGAAQSAIIDVLGTPIVSDFTMSLSQGWELISNPLVLDVSVDSLTFTKDATTKAHAEAVTAGWVNSIYGYSGTGYAVASTFSPWSGYWVAVLETGVDMTFPIHRHDGSDNSRSRDEGWMIAFNAEVEGANDEMMMVGYAETATDGFDAEHDAVNPPNPPGPVYISLFTAHPEWDYLLGDKFTKDIRAEVSANGYQEWILSMESSESEAQISWTFEDVPDEYDIGYSINDGVYFDDMRSVNTTTLSVNTEIIVRVGTQVLGIGDEPIPEVFALHQNYPNPFNPTTQIRYDLPDDALVNITIYDIMGRSIRSLVNSNQTAGYRSIRWDGKNNLGEGVSAGMYIYMIHAGQFRQTKKMVLLK